MNAQSAPTTLESPTAPAWPYSAEAEEVRLRCEALVPIMRERAVDNEARRGIDPETMAALREAGAFTISTPRKWGGLALMPSEQSRIIRTVAHGDSGIAWNVSIASLHAQATTRASQEFQEEVFSSGRGPTFAGAGPLPGSSARKVDGGWMVKGRWDYASTSQYADWLMGGAVVPGPDGGIIPLGFFLPKNEEWLLDNWDVMGLSSSNSQSFEITEEVFVPDHRTGSAMQILAGPPPALAEEETLYGVHLPVFGQVIALSNAVGTYENLLDWWQEATRTRRLPHPDFPIQADNPVTHLKLGAYRAFLTTASTVLEKLAAFADEIAITRRTPTEGEIAEYAAMFNYILVETTNRGLDVMRDSSTSVIRRTHPVQRAVRDLIVMNMHGSSNRDRSFEGYGRYLYGLPGFGFGAPVGPGGGPQPPAPGGAQPPFPGGQPPFPPGGQPPFPGGAQPPFPGAPQPPAAG